MNQLRNFLNKARCKDCTRVGGKKGWGWEVACAHCHKEINRSCVPESQLRHGNAAAASCSKCIAAKARREKGLGH